MDDSTDRDDAYAAPPPKPKDGVSDFGYRLFVFVGIIIGLTCVNVVAFTGMMAFSTTSWVILAIADVAMPGYLFLEGRPLLKKCWTWLQSPDER